MCALQRTSVLGSMVLSTRDAKFIPGGPAGLKIQVREGFLRNPNLECRAHAGLDRSNHTAYELAGGLRALLERCWLGSMPGSPVSCGAGRGSGLAFVKILASLLSTDLLTAQCSVLAAGGRYPLPNGMCTLTALQTFRFTVRSVVGLFGVSDSSAICLLTAAVSSIRARLSHVWHRCY